MAERNQKIYERVLQELAKNPKIGSRELFGIAQTVDKSIGRDTMQQFHARYYLPATRERKAAEGGATAKRPRQQRAKAGRREKAATPAPTTQDKDSEAPQPKRRGLRRTRDITQNGGDRDRIRSLLLQFAQELTDAESRSSLVKVLGRVDTYVEKIAASSAR